MPEPNERKQFADRWLPFIGAAREDLSALPARRPIDQFVQFRDAVLDAAESDEVAEAIAEALENLQNQHPDSPAVELLLRELDAYRAAVGIAKAERESATSPEPRTTNLARFGKTALDSLRDIAEGLPAHIKAILKLLSEVFGIFERK